LTVGKRQRPQFSQNGIKLKSDYWNAFNVHVQYQSNRDTPKGISLAYTCPKRWEVDSVAVIWEGEEDLICDHLVGVG